MGILSWIIVGLLGGALGKVLHPGDDTDGLFRTMILGILGGILGNFVSMKFLGWSSMGGIDFRSIGIAAVGSLVLLLIPRLFKKK